MFIFETIFFKLSLTFFLFNNQTAWPEAYQCPTSQYEIHSPPPHLELGIYFLSSGIVQVFLYMVCLTALSNYLRRHRPPACQLMFLLAITDILQLSVNAILTGVLGIHGKSYCDFPTLIFVAGAIGNGAWMLSCPITMLIALERIIEVREENWLRFLFEKTGFRVIKSILFVWAAYCFFIANPALFLAKYNAWFFDPLMGREPALYRNWAHTATNITVSIVMAFQSIILCCSLCQTPYNTSQWNYKNPWQIAAQCILMGGFHAVTGILYEVMQFVPEMYITEMYIIGQIAWQWTSAIMPIAYIFLNRTIQRELINVFMPKCLRLKLKIPLHLQEHLDAEKAKLENKDSIFTKVSKPHDLGQKGGSVAPKGGLPYMG